MKSDEKKCSRCAEVIKKDALVCKHCGAEFSAAELAAEKAQREKQTQQGAVGCAVVVVLLIIVVTCSSNKSANVPHTKTTAPPSSVLSFDEAKKLTENNRQRIIDGVRDAQRIPSSDFDARLHAYEALVKLGPADQSLVAKRDEYQALVEKSARFSDHPEEALEIKNFTWSKGGVGSIQLVSFVVKNSANFPIKDFELRCVHQGPSGTDIDRNTRTIYEVVPAHGKRKIREFNMGFIAAQAASTGCTITSAVHG